jgi:2-methylisocitrate lyase-like PEP mutase family enzyme
LPEKRRLPPDSPAIFFSAKKRIALSLFCVSFVATAAKRHSAMKTTVTAKRSAFRKLHEQGYFVLPNPWDAGSARMLQLLGFQALASTSSGFAWTTGRPDYAVTRDDVLHHLTSLCNAVDLPVNADYESGFGSSPEELSANVKLAIDTGVSGLSIEDRVVGKVSELYPLGAAVERIRCARKAVDETNSGVILVARTELLLIDPKAISTAIDKLVAFADAGADCLYAPGVRNKADISAMVRAVAPKPVNVLALEPYLSVGEYADLGVRRISVGGALARVAWGAVMAAAEQIKAGSFEALKTGAPGTKLNELFGNFPQASSK